MLHHCHPSITRAFTDKPASRPTQHGTNRRRSAPTYRPRRVFRPIALVLAVLTSILVTVGVLASIPSAFAQAPRPTLEFDRSCYGEQEVMAFSGEQYTPGGDVALLFAKDGQIGDFTTKADAAGAIADQVLAPESDRFLGDTEERGALSVTANDQTRMQDGTASSDPEASFAAAEVTLTRTYTRLTPRKPVPGRRLRVTVRGLAEAAGHAMYLHYLRGSKSLKVTRLGVLKGACGDLVKRIPRAFPMKAVPGGRYTLLVSTERRSPRKGIYFQFSVRVRPGARAR